MAQATNITISEPNPSLSFNDTDTVDIDWAIWGDSDSIGLYDHSFINSYHYYKPVFKAELDTPFVIGLEPDKLEV